MIPAITDFRAKGTIIGLAGLTAVFGMGTGVTPPVWSPESARLAVRPERARGFEMVSRIRRKSWSPAFRRSGSNQTG